MSTMSTKFSYILLAYFLFFKKIGKKMFCNFLVDMVDIY